MVIGTSSGLACQPTHSDLQQYFQWAGGKGHESHLHLLSPVFVQNGTAFRNFNGNQLDFLRMIYEVPRFYKKENKFYR